MIESMSSTPLAPGHTTRAALLTLSICIGLLAGLWLANMGRVVRAAVSTPAHIEHATHVVVLGKRLSAAGVDRDFRARLDRAAALMAADPNRVLLISGGGHGTSEAAAGLLALQQGIDTALDPAMVVLEQASLSTWQNLDNIRQMLPENARPAIVSSRYHMARIARLASQAAMPVDLVSAEPVVSFSMANAGHMLKEALYLTALDLAEIV